VRASYTPTVRLADAAYPTGENVTIQTFSARRRSSPTRSSWTRRCRRATRDGRPLRSSGTRCSS